MGTRIDLHYKLVELLGSSNVYYQPPESLKMKYPAIRYSKSRIESTHANNGKYLKNNRYEIVVIDDDPDNPVIDKLLDLPYCAYDRRYVSNNLYHDVFILYY